MEELTMPGLTYRFNHVHVFCSDLEVTDRWLVEGMGAEVVERRDSAGVPATVLRLGGAQIILRGARPGENLTPPDSRHFGTDHFGYEVDDLDATAAELKRRGVNFEVEPFQFRPGVRIAYVLGPDRVRIELVEEQR